MHDFFQYWAAVWKLHRERERAQFFPVPALDKNWSPKQCNNQELEWGVFRGRGCSRSERIILRNSMRNVKFYQEAVQFLPKGCSRKMPPSFLSLNGVVCSSTLFSNTSALTSSLLFRANSTCKILEHLVWSNTSGFRFWGPLARTDFLSHFAAFPF